MIKRKFGNTGFDITPVVYGGIVSMEDGQDASDKYVSWAIDHGINYFDVAPSYGDAQEKLGNSLIPYRKKIHLACKTGCRMRVDAQKEFEESFRLLHTDYFDGPKNVVLVWSSFFPSENTPITNLTLSLVSEFLSRMTKKTISPIVCFFITGLFPTT